MIEARDWESFVEDEELDLSSVYERAIVQVACNQAISEQEKNQEEDQVPPSYEDASNLFAQVCAGKVPVWWPAKIERIKVKVRALPAGETAEQHGPSPVDPNAGRDLGKKMFVNTLKNMLPSLGPTFDGEIQIQILSQGAGNVGGWKGEVFVGGKKKKRRIGSDDPSSRSEDLIDYLTEQNAKKDQALLGMVRESTANLHGAAAVINATRGVNAAPPWMQQGEDGSMPMWLALAQGVLGVAQGAMQGQTTGKLIQGVMQQPVAPHPLLSGGGVPQITNQDVVENYGSDQYLQEGDYDGYRVDDDDIVDDESMQEFEHGEDEEEGEEEDQEEVELALEGKSPDELISIVEKIIEKHPERLPEYRKAGMRLASKFIG